MTTFNINTLSGCGLAIGGYPRFRYDGRGGSGTGRLASADADGLQQLVFEPGSLAIPPLDWRSTRIVGLPLPPGLRIAIEPLELAGTLTSATGAVRLRFQARFHCSWLGIYRPAPLWIATELSTDLLTSRRHRVAGRPLAADGTALLVGAAMVPPSGDAVLDRFLGLPDEALALLRCRLAPSLNAPA